MEKRGRVLRPRNIIALGTAVAVGAVLTAGRWRDPATSSEGNPDVNYEEIARKDKLLETKIAREEDITYDKNVFVVWKDSKGQAYVTMHTPKVGERHSFLQLSQERGKATESYSLFDVEAEPIIKPLGVVKAEDAELNQKGTVILKAATNGVFPVVEDAGAPGGYLAIGATVKPEQLGQFAPEAVVDEVNKLLTQAQ